MAGVLQAHFLVAPETRIWRYMPLNRFDELLAGRLYFAAAHQFEDAFEGAITEASRKWREEQAARLFSDDESARTFSLSSISTAFADLRRMTKVNCWHRRDVENVAMWERYLGGAPGVAVASSVQALCEALQPFRLKPEYGEETIRVGAVRYLDYARDEMSDSSMLGIFLHKRIEYADEAEVRAVLSLRQASEWGIEIPDDGAVVSIDPATLLHEVRVWPTASATQIAELSTAVRDSGATCPVNQSTLGRPAVY